MNKLALKLAIFLLAVSPLCAFSQTLIGQDSSNRIITTAVPFLGVTPDSRSAGLGDAGVALSPDANAGYWNAGKLTFIDKKFGGSASYTPWLGKIVNDMWIFHLSGFYKINHTQAVAVSMKYFNYGEINFRDINNRDLGRFSPKDVAFDVTYSQLLTEHLGIGGSLRYIYSNLTGSIPTGFDSRPGKSVAVDLGIYYTKPMESSNSTLSLGASITNIGSKITYTGAANKSFIPTNLKIGGAYKTEIDNLNSFTFLLDFNKLLVPSPQYNGSATQPGLLKGVFGSFTDAQGGFKEELHEITTSAGIEYWYAQAFAGRLGYFYEAKDKGNRKYLTTGVGFRYDKFALDVAYLVPTNKRESALAETLRFTIMIQVNTKKKEEEAPTD
jgi:Type IX secretion system protein PorV